MIGYFREREMKREREREVYFESTLAENEPKRWVSVCHLVVNMLS